MDSLIFDRTQTDIINLTSKGYYNYTDLNRIEQWCEYLANILTSYSYNVETDIKTNWTMSDFPTSSELERIRTNVLNLKKAFVSFSQVPGNLENITYQKANDIERILNEIDILLANAENYFVYSGVASAGQSRFWQNRFRRYDRKYFVELLGNSTQETSKTSDDNICPDIDKWTLKNGAYVENGYIVLPDMNSTASINLKWNDGNTVYIGAQFTNKPFATIQGFAGTTLNGAMYRSTTIDSEQFKALLACTDPNIFGISDNITITFSRHSSNAPNEYRFKNIIVSPNPITEYVPYFPNKPSPELPSEITKISGTASVDIGDVTKTITPLHDMYSIGNVADRIYTDGYGNWYDEKKCGIVELTGNEGWTYNSAQNAFWIRNNVISDSLNVAHQKLCTHFAYSNQNFAQAPINTLCENSIPEMSMFIFKVDTNVATTVDEWKAFLIEQNTNGAPVTVLYQLATPIITKITDTDMINTLDEIRDLMQNEGITSKNFY